MRRRAARRSTTSRVPANRLRIIGRQGASVGCWPGRWISTSLVSAEAAVRRSAELGVEAIELHTGRYAHRRGDPAPLAALDSAARLGAELGLAVHAGHGLTVRNVEPVAAIPEIEELNIGHSIVSRAVFVGLATSVREMRAAMDAARGAVVGATR